MKTSQQQSRINAAVAALVLADECFNEFLGSPFQAPPPCSFCRTNSHAVKCSCVEDLKVDVRDAKDVCSMFRDALRHYRGASVSRRLVNALRDLQPEPTPEPYRHGGLARIAMQWMNLATDLLLDCYRAGRRHDVTVSAAIVAISHASSVIESDTISRDANLSRAREVIADYLPADPAPAKKPRRALAAC